MRCEKIYPRSKSRRVQGQCSSDAIGTYTYRGGCAKQYCAAHLQSAKEYEASQEARETEEKRQSILRELSKLPLEALVRIQKLQSTAA